MIYQDFFSLAQAKGIENIQITEETQKENSIYLIDKKLQDYTDSEKITYLVKAEIDGKTEQLFTEYLDESIIDIIIEKLNTTDSNYNDEYLALTTNNEINDVPNIDITQETDRMIHLNDLAKNYSKIKNLELAYSDMYRKTRIINNRGVDIATSAHNYELYVGASAQEDEKISSYSEAVLVSDKTKLDFPKTINDVLNLATLAINKKKLETKKYDIVLNEEVASQIIREMQAMLSAENIHQKKSCLESKLNEKVFSDKLTIIEEPLNKVYPGYTIFDKEGTKTKNKLLIENGIIKQYIYDIKESKLDNISSTGNKYNGIGTRNMYVIPGDKSLEEIFKKVNNGIYITHYMGSMGSIVNASSGNVSMQVFGYIIENGKLVCGFEPAVLTTTIFELLSNIEEIGNMLKFSSLSAASPALYIKDISIAGK